MSALHVCVVLAMGIAVVILLICNVELSRRADRHEKYEKLWQKAADGWMAEAEKFSREKHG